MKHTVFVDGQEGTTGLQIHERLAARDDITVLSIDPDKRKDTAERRRLLNAADIAFLCLPDDAARESVSLIDNDRTRVIDASTAHRVAEGWVYGIPELAGHTHAIQAASRISVPGCYASGFVMLARPLVDLGILPRDYPVVCHAMSGYSGGGKKMIAEYEGEPNSARTPALYGLTLAHKHIPEMHKHSGLDYPPVFSPSVAGYYCGMTVCIPLHTRLLGRNITAQGIADTLDGYYAEKRFVRVFSPADAQDALESGRLYADNLRGTNNIELFVFGGEDTVMAIARLDNLGKGASGAAVQCMNLMIGADEGEGV